MPEILPQITPQAQPATSAAPQQPVKGRATPERSESDADTPGESFAETFEALGAEVPTPDADVDVPTEQLEPALTALPVVAPEVAAVPVSTDAEAEAEPEQLTGGREKLLTKADAALPRTTQAPSDAAPRLTAARTDAPQIAPSAPRGPEVAQNAPPPAETPQIPSDAETPAPRAFTPVTPDWAARAQPLPTPSNPKEITSDRIPLIASDAKDAPLPEFEAPLPERVGLREPAPQAQPGAQAVVQPLQLQLPGQGVDAAAANPTALDEVLPAVAQSGGLGSGVSPTAPGTAPTQIVQHAAGQIVAALPRDQGVFITDAGAEIALDPPELGRVRMIVTEVAGGLALTVTAERQETLDLFRRNAAMLAEEFAREGLADTNFAFEGESERNGSEADGRDDRTTLAIAADQQELINGITAQVGQNSGLDLRL